MCRPSKRLLVIGAATLVALIGVVLWTMALVTHGWRTAEEWQQAYIHHTVLELRVADGSIQQFRQQQGRLPGSLSEVGQKPFVDAWGRELVFRPEDTGGFILFSKGPDGIAGTADDVFLPEAERSRAHARSVQS